MAFLKLSGDGLVPKTAGDTQHKILPETLLWGGRFCFIREAASSGI